MRNVFIIPTRKSSELFLSHPDKVLGRSYDLMRQGSVNVYITSDDKFIRDEYVTDGFEVIKSSPKLVDAQGLVDRRNWRKIVMTTDMELIKDGIQEIGDKFLDWFLLNPTCEKVEVQPFYTMSQSSYSGIEYDIILPKENLGYTTKMGIEVSDEMVRSTMVPKDKFDNALDSFKDSLIKKYEPTLGEKLEKIVSKEPSKFWDESDERVRLREVLTNLSLVNPVHLKMTSDGYGEFPDGYKLTEKGIQYVMEQIKKK